MKHRRFLGLLAALPVPAFAHPGHSELASVAAGFWHPWLGLDHAMVLLAAGAWLALQNHRAALSGALGLAAALCMGTLLGGRFATMNLEPAVILSLLAMLIALVGFARARDAVVAAALCAIGGVHGWVHGMEVPAGNVGFIAGLLFGSAGLLALAFTIAKALNTVNGGRWVRVLGASAAGVGLLAGV